MERVRQLLLPGHPEVLDADSDQIPYPTNEVGVPAKNRFNLGVNWNSKRFMGSATLNYSDKAFWNDVLDSPYHGNTDSYTMVNANFGVKWADGKYQAIAQGHEPDELEDPAAHLRRHHQAVGERRAAHLREVKA